MKSTLLSRLAATAVLTATGGSAAFAQAGDGSLQFADLGRCHLDSGDIIEDCRLGYRTYGTLDETGSNVVLVPAWFGGTSEDLAGFIRAGGLVDPERWFVIVVDPLGNGVSVSPSNSRRQPADSFPGFTIGDMVEAERRMLHEKLGIDSLAGVVGISMGGMQALEWAVRYPESVDAVVAIAASPRAGPYARVAWDAFLRLIRLLDGPESAEAQAILAELEYLRGTSPAFVHRHVSPDGIPALLDSLAAEHMFTTAAMNQASQARAVAGFDVAAPYGGDLARAARRVRGRLTIIVTESDHHVTPFTAIEFAELTGARLLLLENDCGHIGASCEPGRVLEAVRTTLEPPADGSRS